MAWIVRLEAHEVNAAETNAWSGTRSPDTGTGSADRTEGPRSSAARANARASKLD